MIKVDFSNTFQQPKPTPTTNKYEHLDPRCRKCGEHFDTVTQKVRHKCASTAKS